MNFRSISQYLLLLFIFAKACERDEDCEEYGCCLTGVCELCNLGRIYAEFVISCIFFGLTIVLLVINSILCCCLCSKKTKVINLKGDLNDENKPNSAKYKIKEDSKADIKDESQLEIKNESQYEGADKVREEQKEVPDEAQNEAQNEETKVIPIAPDSP